MATGDQNDIATRLQSLIPPSWFPDGSPVVNSILQGFATVGAWAYSLIAFAYLQIRLVTASGIFVDLFSFDYLGLRVTRRLGELDAQWRLRVKREILRERVTRKGMYQALLDLTGFAPVIIEPWNTGDCGAVARPGGAIGYSFALAGVDPGTSNGVGVGALGLGVGNGCFYAPPKAGSSFQGAGYMGSLSYPNQVFVRTKLPGLQGVPNVAGIGTPGFAFGIGSGELINGSFIVGAVTTQDVYDTINATKPEGSTVWVALT
jgi:hypothetical protein